MKSRLANILNVLMKNSSTITKRFLKKGGIAMGILLLVLLLKTLNIKTTNVILGSFKDRMNHEFSIVDDSKRIFNKAKGLLDNSQKILEVFNLTELDKYPAPIAGKLHKGYNKDTNNGIDIKSQGELEARAIMDGIVSNVLLSDNKGYYVTVETGDFQYTYGYLSKPYVMIGDKVVQGDIIGYLGTNKDGNKYLRFEVMKDGTYVDPENYIELH